MKAKPATRSRVKARKAPGKARSSTKRKLDASGLAWLLDRKLPPQDQLPENPVLVLRRM